MNPQQIFDQAREQMIEELGLQLMTPEKQDEILDAVNEFVLARVLAAILEVLPEEHHEKFQKLMDSDQSDAAQALVKKFVPNIDLIVQNAVVGAIEDHKADVRAVLAKTA